MIRSGTIMLTTGLICAGFEAYTFIFANNPFGRQQGIALLCTYPAIILTLNGLEKFLENISCKLTELNDEIILTLKYIAIIAFFGFLIFNIKGIAKVLRVIIN